MRYASLLFNEARRESQKTLLKTAWSLSHLQQAAAYFRTYEHAFSIVNGPVESQNRGLCKVPT